jgi:hypothetical protein
MFRGPEGGIAVSPEACRTVPTHKDYNSCQRLPKDLDNNVRTNKHSPRIRFRSTFAGLKKRTTIDETGDDLADLRYPTSVIARTWKRRGFEVLGHP